MFFTVAVLVIILLIIASICDIRTREIPDWISIVIGLVALGSAWIGWLGIDFRWVLVGGVVGLAIGYFLFRYAKLGGGDAKLIAALGMLVGPMGLMVVLFGMAVAGGALSIIAMIRGKRDFAYVPAIALGFLGYINLVSNL